MSNPFTASGWKILATLEGVAMAFAWLAFGAIIPVVLVGVTVAAGFATYAYRCG